MACVRGTWFRTDALPARQHARGNEAIELTFAISCWWGALVSTLLFGFPVFCLVCPIGLTFGTVFLFANLFMHGDVSWMTAVVPIVLLVEVVAFSKWCHALCPLGALMSLISKGNKTFVPKVNDRACLETSKGTSCGVCAAVCPEGINPRYPEISETAMCECTKCRACVESCPGHAISMPLLAKSAQANEQKGNERMTPCSQAVLRSRFRHAHSCVRQNALFGQ